MQKYRHLIQKSWLCIEFSNQHILILIFKNFLLFLKESILNDSIGIKNEGDFGETTWTLFLALVRLLGTLLLVQFRNLEPSEAILYLESY